MDTPIVGGLGQIRTMPASRVTYGPWIDYGPIRDNFWEAARPAYTAGGYPLVPPGGGADPALYSTIPDYFTPSALTGYGSAGSSFLGLSTIGTAEYSLGCTFEITNSLAAHLAQIFPHQDADARACAMHHAAWGAGGGMSNWDPGEACPALGAPLSGFGGTAAVGDASSYHTYPSGILLADEYTAFARQTVTTFWVRNQTVPGAQASLNVAAQLPPFWDYWFRYPIFSSSGVGPVGLAGYWPVEFRRTRVDVMMRVYSSAPDSGETPAVISSGFTINIREDPRPAPLPPGTQAIPELSFPTPLQLAGLGPLGTLAADAAHYTGADYAADAIPRTPDHNWYQMGGPTVDENLQPLAPFDSGYPFFYGLSDHGSRVRLSSSRVELEMDPAPDNSHIATPWVVFEATWYGQYRIPKPVGAPPLRQVQTRGWHSGSPAGKSSARQHSTRQTGYY